MSREEDWLTALPVMLIGLRATLHADGYAPFLAVTRKHMIVPTQLVEPLIPGKNYQIFLKIYSKLWDP